MPAVPFPLCRLCRSASGGPGRIDADIGGIGEEGAAIFASDAVIDGVVDALINPFIGVVIGVDEAVIPDGGEITDLREFILGLPRCSLASPAGAPRNRSSCLAGSPSRRSCCSGSLSPCSGRSRRSGSLSPCSSATGSLSAGTTLGSTRWCAAGLGAAGARPCGARSR